MALVEIISSSIRTGRDSHKLALYFQKYINEHQIATAKMLDLYEYQFPLFDERLSKQVNPIPKAIEFAERIKNADGVLIVTPEYNGGYPASLKNVIDLLYTEWQRKPVALASASSGPFGASQVLTSLQFTLWKIKAWVVPATFQAPFVDKAFDEDGVPAAKEDTDKLAAVFIKELVWCMEAKSKMPEE